MKSSVCVVGAYLVVNTWGIGGLAATIDRVPALPASQGTVLAQGNTQTLLRFETQHYVVRIYRRSGKLLLNVYNKETGFTDQNGVPAQVAPPRSDDDAWRTYVNQDGDLLYLARVHPSGQTELEIRLAEGPPAQPEAGFNATYGFPHMYLGQDIDDTLAELEESGWTIDSTSGDGVELTRNQLALDLKFDPDTRIVTYTQLIDLT